MEEIRIGIIGGSGLYAMESLKNISEIHVDTIYGKTSDAVVTGEINGIKVAFLARHGRNHSIMPSEVPYKANIYAMKKLGVRYLISVSAVGSLREELKPRDVVILNQYIDYTKNRDMSFFGNGMVAHVSMAQPTCQALNEILAEATQTFIPQGSQDYTKAGKNKHFENITIPGVEISCEVQDEHGIVNNENTVVNNENIVASNENTVASNENTVASNENTVEFHMGGTYICIEGPQFSSFAESNMFRFMGADIIGMTNMPEAKLAREAQMAYSSLAMVTDYDCWHPHEEAVNVDMLIANLMANSKLAQNIIQEAVLRIADLKPSSIAHVALKQALLTPLECLNAEQKILLELLMK